MVGQNIGKYHVLERVGRGGMGTVYRATDETLHREVAIKVLNAELNDPNVARRFRAEAVTVARLNHPSIATVFELFQHDGQWLMVMEFVRGETLETLVARQGALPVDQATDLSMQALGALAHAHSLGVVHRDLKPANLMITSSGTLKIMDFGIARVAGTEHLTSVGFMMGTPDYMAPEQVRGQEIDARADLYSLGVVLYFLTTAHLPFKASTPFEAAQARLQDPPIPILSLRNDLPAWLGRVMELALAAEPAQRFQTAPVFREALRRGLARLPIETPISTTIPPELVITAVPGSMPVLTIPAAPAAATSAGVSVASPPISPPTPQNPFEGVRPGPTSGVPDAPLNLPAPPEVPATALPAHTGAKGRPASSDRLALIAGVVLLLALGAWLLMRSAPAPQSDIPAAPAQATSTSDPATGAPAAPPAGSPAVASDSSTAATPGPGDGRSSAAPLAAGTTPASGSSDPTPSGAPGAPSAGAAATQPASGGAAAGGAAKAAARGRGADPHIAFANVRAFVVSGKKASEQDAVLHLVNGRVSLLAAKTGGTLASMQYVDAVRATYAHAKDPKWDAKLAAPPVDVDMPGGMFRGARHWFALQSRTTFLIFRVSDDDWQKVSSTIAIRTGLTVETSGS